MQRRFEVSSMNSNPLPKTSKWRGKPVSVRSGSMIATGCGSDAVCMLASSTLKRSNFCTSPSRLLVRHRFKKSKKTQKKLAKEANEVLADQTQMAEVRRRLEREAIYAQAHQNYIPLALRSERADDLQAFQGIGASLRATRRLRRMQGSASQQLFVIIRVVRF